MSAPVEFLLDIACDDCGRFGAFQFDDEKLCLDCYQRRCSCCPEFDPGKGDLPDKPAGP